MLEIFLPLSIAEILSGKNARAWVSIVLYFRKNKCDFIKNPQTRNARAFLPFNISAVGSVKTEGHHDEWKFSIT